MQLSHTNCWSGKESKSGRHYRQKPTQPSTIYDFSKTCFMVTWLECSWKVDKKYISACKQTSNPLTVVVDRAGRHLPEPVEHVVCLAGDGAHRGGQDGKHVGHRVSRVFCHVARRHPCCARLMAALFGLVEFVHLSAHVVWLQSEKTFTGICFSKRSCLGRDSTNCRHYSCQRLHRVFNRCDS